MADVSKRPPEIPFPQIPQPDTCSPELRRFFVQLRDYLQKMRLEIIKYVEEKT